MPPVNEAADDIIAALSNVIDPELGIDFVDLGLVYEVTEEADTIHVLFTLTSPGCPIGPDVSRQMSEEVLAVRPGAKVYPLLTFDPPWTEAKMSEDAKFALGI